MQKSQIQLVGRMLREESRLAGVPLLWRYPPLTGILPQAQYHHCNAFCMAVKKGQRRQDQCNTTESSGLAEMIARHGRPFLKPCHAGVREYVVPILLDGTCRGALIAGPFRPAGERCPYARLQKTYEAVPALSATRIKRLDPLLRGAADHIRALYRLEAFSRQPGTANDLRIVQALRHIETHLGDPLPVADLARICYLSPSRFVHLFRQEVGMPFQQYRTEARIRAAKQRLATTDQPLAELAGDLGFSDQSHFGAAFRRCEGLTPARFRQNRRREDLR